MKTYISFIVAAYIKALLCDNLYFYTVYRD
jgi:hypothetical protein